MESRWAKNFDKCVKCGTVSIPFKAKGMCIKCYAHENHKKRGYKQKFICLNCGVEFTPKFYTSNVRKFCSYECSKQYRIGKHRGRVKTYEEVLSAMHAVILAEGRYIQKNELLPKVGICSETFNRLGFTMADIYAELRIAKRQQKEEIAYYALKPYIPDLRISKAFDDCISPKGYKLRFDLFSADLAMAIEIDGEHHRYSKVTDAMAFVQLCDSIKDEYIRSMGATMVRIPIERNQIPVFSSMIQYFPKDIAICL